MSWAWNVVTSNPSDGTAATSGLCALICACTYVRAAAGLFRTCEVIQTIPLVCRDIMSLATETASQWHTHHGLDAASTSSKQD
jgi:hypothetical protein